MTAKEVKRELFSFLKREECLKEFKECFREDAKHSSMTYEKLFTRYPPKDIIWNAFIWKNSRFWNNISDKWDKYCKNNKIE